MAISAKALFEGIYKVQQEPSTNQRTRTGNKYHSGYRSSTKKKRRRRRSHTTHTITGEKRICVYFELQLNNSFGPSSRALDIEKRRALDIEVHSNNTQHKNKTQSFFYNEKKNIFIHDINQPTKITFAP